MVRFKTDPSLGPTVSEYKCWTFGYQPIESMFQLSFAAGGNKFSQLCSFKFTSAMPNAEFPTFSIAFVAKLRSKIYRQATRNPSQWYIFKKISFNRTDVLTKQQLLINYGFDIDKFFDSDVFKVTMSKIKSYIKNGLENDVPRFKATLKTQQEKFEADKYADSIAEALKLIDRKTVNDTYYSLRRNLDLKDSEQSDDVEKFECYVEKVSDGFGIYQKNGNRWIATFADEDEANAFAAEYPVLMAEHSAEVTAIESEKAETAKKIEETDDEKLDRAIEAEFKKRGIYVDLDDAEDVI